MKVTRDQRLRLSQLGFNWATKKNRLDQLWAQQFEILRTYEESETGNYREDKVIHEWVRTQTKAFKKGRLREDRLEQMQSLGFFMDAAEEKMQTGEEEETGEDERVDDAADTATGDDTQKGSAPKTSESLEAETTGDEEEEAAG